MSEEVEKIVDPKDVKIAELEAKIEELAKAPHVCKRCGRNNMEADLKVKEEILQEYFRSLLGQRPFTHTLKAMNGMLNIEFTLQRGDTLLASLSSGPTQEIGSDSMATMLMMSTLSAVTFVDKERGISKVIYSADLDKLTSAVDNYKEYYDALIKSIDAVQLSVLRQASMIFNMLVMQLMTAVVNKDFYEGAGLV